jgi:apolipoprotein N-acyltransferase
MRTALSWLVAHHFWIKIFPWDFGHTQLAFVPFAQLAGILGVTGITFMMMWVVETLCNRRNVTMFARGLALASFTGAISYGYLIQETIQSLPIKPLSTIMIQGNVSLQHKHDMAFFTVNREQYLKTSMKVAEKDSLVIWPESTITEFIPANIEDVSRTSLLPYLGNGSAFLVGGLTYRSRKEYFNSSILVRPDGTVPQPYNKMILMPFGEYTPFASVLPWLAEINATAGQFTAGESPSLLSFNLSNQTEVKLAHLICYEDVVPSLAREATARGAEVLINQTNDAWFGDTVAPYQHHMIAAFRAIENRRFLLRSTNTGLTAVVDPLGRTLASLLPYTESVLPMEISLISYESTFTTIPIYLMWLALATITAFVIIAVSLRSRAAGTKSI